jgi:hypothetical protein
MKELVLLDFLQNKVSVEILANDLKGSQERTSFDTTTMHIEDLKSEDSFEITKGHLLRLCNETLAGRLSTEDLNTIAYCVFTSEFFTHDQNDEILDRVLFDWDNPEIGFPLTLANMAKWKELLETGNDLFDINELKQQKKNNR